jgi:hypothetical protein
VLYAENSLFFDQIQFNDKLGFWNLLPLWTTLDLIISQKNKLDLVESDLLVDLSPYRPPLIKAAGRSWLAEKIAVAQYRVLSPRSATQHGFLFNAAFNAARLGR